MAKITGIYFSWRVAARRHRSSSIPVVVTHWGDADDADHTSRRAARGLRTTRERCTARRIIADVATSVRTFGDTARRRRAIGEAH